MITQNQKLNNLQRKIILNNESEFFISESRKINKDAFFKIKKNISYFLSSFQNKKIAIKFSEDLNSAIFIPILDGLVKSLLILPSDFSEEEEKELLRKAKVKNVLVDNELLIKKNKFVQYFKVDEINSNSVHGYTTIRVKFDFKMPVDEALGKVKDAVDQARTKSDFPQLPAEPNIFELDPSKMPILNINMRSDNAQ